jgi:UDP-galactopyranose mutase
VKTIAIAGAGLAGSVLARELAETGHYKITVFEQRDHLAGNCHTVRDASTGVMIHQYGPHIFHTNREDVWKYMNLWTEFGAYTNRVKAVTARGVYSLPVNLLTINQFFGKQFNPKQAQEFIAKIGDWQIEEPLSFEQQALKFLGRELYENFFYGYTKKQWGVDPKDLPASLLKRLPVRFNYNDNYYDSRFQGIPLHGYTPIVEKMLDHPNIQVRLREKFDLDGRREFSHLFYSGPMDGFFNFSLGRLKYRTLVFERFSAEGDYQGNPVINYCEEKVPFTRITEHKHFTPWESHDGTVCFREYSKFTEGTDTPYYPMRLADDKELLQGYMKLVEEQKQVTFIGRLGTYRYLDMHMVVGESLDLANVCRSTNIENWPKYSQSPM